MKNGWTILAMAACMTVAGTCSAIDQIKTSTEEKPVRGHITGVTKLAVSVEATSGETREIPANEIASIVFENEPSGLLEAHVKMLHGEYEDALANLEKASAEDTSRREMAEDIEFSKAFCSAQLALAGTGNVAAAGSQMLKFVNQSPNSYHFLPACELVGNLLVAAGQFDKAEEYYQKLAKAPWPDYKMRAQIAMGRALLAQGKAAGADKAFNEVLANEAPGELAEGQRMAATVGKARCLVLAGKADQAIKSLNEIIAKVSSDNVEINALAYNALGTALRKSDRPKIEAVLAFLHVDLLYSSIPEAHAEALANLESLFEEIHKPDHARQVRAVLDERYKGSRWAMKKN